MSRISKNLKVRLNLQIDEVTLGMTRIMRDKYHINLSSLCREAITNAFHKLEQLTYENNKVK